MTKLYQFQKEDVRELRRQRYRSLVASEMGTGKSIVALFAAAESGARPVVVVCPAGLKYHWEAEALLHCGLRAEVLSGTRPPRRCRFPHPLVVINYDILGPWMPFLKKLDPELVILDEVQYIKNRAAQRTKNVQALCRGVKKIIGLSGTPLTNRPAELWVILNILWPDKFPSFTKYGFRYCRPSFEFGEIKFKGANHLPELHGKLKRYGMIRRLKKDVLTELPPKTRIVVPLPITARSQNC